MPATDTALLAADFERRFGGLARLYGSAGATRIRQAHIVIVGVGGVGSWAAEAVARCGVRRVTLVDLDHIAESNINRQVQAVSATVGMSKVDAMRERMLQIHPDCEINCIEEFAEPGNWPGVLGLGADFAGLNVAVIDACDQIQAKTAIAVWALQNKARWFVSSGAAGGKRLAHQVDIADLSLVTHDPLLAQMRYRLRKTHCAARGAKKIGVACVFSREAVTQAGRSSDSVSTSEQEELPESVQTDASLNCHGYGSVVSVTATFGLCAAGWVLSKIAEPV